MLFWKILLEWLTGLLPGLLLLPPLLLILYLRGSFRQKIRYRFSHIPGVNDPSFGLTVASLSASMITEGNFTGFWSAPREIYQMRLKAIASAQHRIDFETFFMTPGRRADEFATALIARSQAGVQVRMIVDHFGIRRLPQHYWQRLQQAGVEVRFFHPFDWRAPLTYLYRTHRKLLIIDEQVALTGGTGISDDWDGQADQREPWLDSELRFEGAIVPLLEGLFLQDWVYTGGKAILNPPQLQASCPGPATPFLVTPSESSYRVSPIDTLFYLSILAAKQQIWIASPYFLLEPNLRYALRQAKRQGIDVRILTVGPHNDKKIVYYAVRERYGDLLGAGIQIYEYQPSMMHAKVMLVDNFWVSLGSANFDPRSFFLNDELNLSLAAPPLTQAVQQFFQEAFTKSHLIERSPWQQRRLYQRLLGQLALFFRWQL